VFCQSPVLPSPIVSVFSKGKHSLVGGGNSSGESSECSDGECGLHSFGW